MELTVIIPAYNEESNLQQTIEEINESIDRCNILVVNDGSSDGTGRILDKLKKEHKNLSAVTHPKNRGYGAALVTGFLKADTKYLAFLDADRTYPAKYIPRLLTIQKKYNLDSVWCNRFGNKKNEMPLIRKIGNKLLSFLFFLMTFRHVPDVCSGERLFTKEGLMKINPKTLPSGLDMITAMSKRCVVRRLRFRWISIEYPRRGGKSKLNVVTDFLRMSRNILFEK